MRKGGGLGCPFCFLGIGLGLGGFVLHEGCFVNEELLCCHSDGINAGMAPRWSLKGNRMRVSKLYESEPKLLAVLLEHGGNVEAIDMVTDRLAGAGLCRPRGDVSGLGALRMEATLHAMKRGRITQDKAAADLTRWGLL